LVCEEGISYAEAISNLLVPQRIKKILAQKPQIVLQKTRMHYTNCDKINHNVETYRIKRKEDLVPIVFKVIIQ
jgi:hypothetical protein